MVVIGPSVAGESSVASASPVREEARSPFRTYRVPTACSMGWDHLQTTSLTTSGMSTPDRRSSRPPAVSDSEIRRFRVLWPAEQVVSEEFSVFEPDPSARITADNFTTASLDAWQAAFWNLYGTVDLDIPLYDMMLQLVGDSTSLAEAIRKRDYTEAFPVLPRIFSWLTTMVSKVRVQTSEYADIGDGKSLSEIVWNKYPSICYHCGFDRCVCILYDVDKE